MNYYIWNLVNDHVYQGRREPFEDVNELKATINAAWTALQDIDGIHAAIMQFLPRLREVVKHDGGATQHIFG